MKKNKYIPIVMLLTVLGISLAWYGVFKTEEYKIVNNYLINDFDLDKKLGSNSKHLLISFKVNGGEASTSYFTFLIIKGLDFKLVTLKLDKKVNPWKVNVAMRQVEILTG